MDLIRRPYTTKCRFFRDSSIEIDIAWYPCKPDAPAIDTPSVISSLDWWVQERELGVFAGYKVGEVPGAPRVYNAQKVNPKADGRHRCGTADEWANGAAYDPTFNSPRRADGLPVCCGADAKAILLGGRSLPISFGWSLQLGGRQPAHYGPAMATCADMLPGNAGQIGPDFTAFGASDYVRVFQPSGWSGPDSWNFFVPSPHPFGNGIHMDWMGARAGTLTIYSAGAGICGDLVPVLTQDARLPLSMDFDLPTYGGRFIVLRVTDAAGGQLPYDVFLQNLT